MRRGRLLSRLLGLTRWRRFVPRGLKHRLVRMLNQGLGVTAVKYAAELDFWQARFDAENGDLFSAGYEQVMLELAGEPDARFVGGKVVADFGCGPRGSLCWATGARERLGIDVLAGDFSRFGVDTQAMTPDQTRGAMRPACTRPPSESIEGVAF